MSLSKVPTSVPQIPKWKSNPSLNASPWTLTESNINLFSFFRDKDREIQENKMFNNQPFISGVVGFKMMWYWMIGDLKHNAGCRWTSAQFLKSKTGRLRKYKRSKMCEMILYLLHKCRIINFIYDISNGPWPSWHADFNEVWKITGDHLVTLFWISGSDWAALSKDKEFPFKIKRMFCSV